MKIKPYLLNLTWWQYYHVNKTTTMMKIFKNILAPTPKKNKRDGKIATALAGIAETVALSGALDNKPLIKY